MKQIIALLLITLFVTTNYSCNKCKETKEIIDLLIPVTLAITDANNLPVLNYYGQQMYGHNELYYNERTGEYFTPEFPPRYGITAGDIIQLGTRVYNQFAEKDCEIGTTSPTSNTAPTLNFQDYYGKQGFFNLSGMPTPPIQNNSNQWTATRFQVTAPGYYKINFNANNDQLFGELGFENNWYYGDQNGYQKSPETNSQVWFKVTENPNFNCNYNEPVRSFNAPANVSEMQEMEISKFVRSEQFSKWFLNKSREKQAHP